MGKLLLIIVMVTQLGCAGVFWQTIGGTLIGSVAAEMVKDEIDKAEKDEAPQP